MGLVRIDSHLIFHCVRDRPPERKNRYYIDYAMFYLRELGQKTYR